MSLITIFVRYNILSFDSKQCKFQRLYWRALMRLLLTNHSMHLCSMHWHVWILNHAPRDTYYHAEIARSTSKLMMWASSSSPSSLKHRRTEVDKKFFNSISQPDSCLHHLLPPPRDTKLITKLRYANTYPVPLIKTKRFCSFVNYGLANYVDWFVRLYIVCILCVYFAYCILYFCRPILIYV